jgi:hypothetical protein
MYQGILNKLQEIFYSGVITFAVRCGETLWWKGFRRKKKVHKAF